MLLKCIFRPYSVIWNLYSKGKEEEIYGYCPLLEVNMDAIFARPRLIFRLVLTSSWNNTFDISKLYLWCFLSLWLLVIISYMFSSSHIILGYPDTVNLIFPSFPMYYAQGLFLPSLPVLTFPQIPVTTPKNICKWIENEYGKFLI